MCRSDVERAESEPVVEYVGAEHASPEGSQIRGRYDTR